MASACSVAVATDCKTGGADFLRTSASTCVLVTVSLICTCFLVVCGVLVVREYSLAFAYEETKCRLKNITYSKQDINCIFCAGFKDKNRDKSVTACTPSQFPCVQLMVVYSISDVPYEALLHPDSLQASGAYSKCSFSVCLKTREENQKAVEDFVEDWKYRMENSIPCFYDTHSWQNVIAQKMYSKSDVIHTMLWPSLIVVACGVIFLRLEVKRRRLTFCGRRPSDAGGDSDHHRPVRSRHGSSADVVKLETVFAEKRDLRSTLLGSPAATQGRGRLAADIVGQGLSSSCTRSDAGPTVVYKSLPSSLDFDRTVKTNTAELLPVPSQVKGPSSSKGGSLYKSVSIDYDRYS